MPGIVLPIFLVGGVVSLLLALMEQMPLLIAGKPIDSYPTIEAAQRALGQEIWTPAYFPDYLNWPPTSILVQRQPVTEVRLAFSSQEGVVSALVLAQRLTTEESTWVPLRGGEMVVRRHVNVGENPGILIEMRGKDEARYYQLQWQMSGRSLALASFHSPDDLLLIAQSLRPRGQGTR